MQKTKHPNSFMRRVFSVSFVLSAFVLAAAAVGLRPGIAQLSRYFSKEKIESNLRLNDFDITRLASFQAGWDVEECVLGEEIQTDNAFLTRLTRYDRGEAIEFAALFVTYYSDPKDKVPHTPDVCSRQAGAIVKSLSTITLEIPELAPENSPIQASLVLTDEGDGYRSIIFFFVAEGQIIPDRKRCRWALGKPGNKHTYFSKVEVHTNYKDDSNLSAAIELSETMVREALPVLLKDYYPQKEQLKGE